MRPSIKKATRKKVAAKKTSVRISPSRAAAFQILLELSRSASAHSDDLLQSERVDRLSAPDRNLCMTLTMGVLRWQLFLDAHIANLLTHKTKLDEPVRIALRLAAFQLLFLDRIPAHAALSDSVELTKRAGHQFASGLVNAVLRKLAAGAGQVRLAIDAATAHPDWMLQRWTTFFGAEAAQSICNYDQYPPAPGIRLASDEAATALLDEGVSVSTGVFLERARSLLAGDVANTEAVRDGVVRLQDEGSQLVAEMLGWSASPPSAILDCCAAPGGKTAILAEHYPQSRIVARDVSASRAARMKAAFEKTPTLARIEVQVADALHQHSAERFDLILCDVPCSGTGTLARNPEIKLRLTVDEIARQKERQVAILRASLQLLSPQGTLVYATCSLEAEENEQVIEAVLAGEQSFKLLPVRQRIEELRASGVLHANGAALLLDRGVSGDFLRLTPGVFPTDGFFAAILTCA